MTEEITSYIEKTGVIAQITDVLKLLYEMDEKPVVPLECLLLEYGQVEDWMVQRGNGPVAGEKFFHGSGTSPAQGTVQIPGDISIENELAFRGHNESSSSLNKGHFKELFDMHITRCSLEIQNHYNAIKNIFSGLSNTIQNDLITCVSDHIRNMVKTEFKECMFYSVQVDDTTDISQRTQCSIILRYITNKSELVERFLGFYVSEDRTAEGLFNTLNSVLLEFDTEKKNESIYTTYRSISTCIGLVSTEYS
ncbi:hypothetical protein QTP88_001223 [Uroleucon formosanum]